MTNNFLGELRRSAVVMTFAPGAVVDFRADEGAVSAVIGGLEEWDRSFRPPGLANPQVIYEERLQQKLRVAGFRLPPVALEQGQYQTQADTRALVAARFPRWLQCPKCDTIAMTKRWSWDPGQAYRYCGKCSAGLPGGRKVMVIPVRFVMACSAGHLDEFPWHWWVQHEPNCKNAMGEGALTLKTEGAGLAGLVLSCPSCRARRTMETIFQSHSIRSLTCRARRPWLSVERDPMGCQAVGTDPPPELRIVQRGASNLYFPAIESALSIPPWTDELQQVIGMYWDPIMQVATAADRAMFIRLLAGGPLAESVLHLGVTVDELIATIESRVTAISAIGGQDIRSEEYQRLASGSDTDRQAEFELHNSKVPVTLARHVSRLVRVSRLREVRAITGFTRIYPPFGTDRTIVAPLSSERLNWLPAIEVRGEGIFVALRSDALRNWELQTQVVQRIDGLRRAAEEDWAQRYHGRRFTMDLSPRFVLLHTLAHALIRELTLECGYSSAALRERLYVSAGDDGMAGILIYTATADSDGTLGGLERQGHSDRMEHIFRNGVSAMEWCSSDPLCIEGAMTGKESLSLAACHACCLAPETSCEHYNRYLDRALLVGTPAEPGLGFFRDLLTH